MKTWGCWKLWGLNSIRDASKRQVAEPYSALILSYCLEVSGSCTLFVLNAINFLENLRLLNPIRFEFIDWDLQMRSCWTLFCSSISLELGVTGPCRCQTDKLAVDFLVIKCYGVVHLLGGWLFVPPPRKKIVSCCYMVTVSTTSGDRWYYGAFIRIKVKRRLSLTYFNVDFIQIELNGKQKQRWRCRWGRHFLSLATIRDLYKFFLFPLSFL